MHNPSHDFLTPIENTSSELAKQILALAITKQDVLLAPFNPKQTLEEKANHEEVGNDFAIEVMRLISVSDLPADYASSPIDKCMVMLTVLKKFIDGTVNQQKDELMALTIGVKSPMSDKYRADVATLGEVMLALNNAREMRGTTQKDFLNEIAPEISTEEKPENGVAPETAA